MFALRRIGKLVEEELLARRLEGNTWHNYYTSRVPGPGPDGEVAWVRGLSFHRLLVDQAAIKV